MSQTVPDALVEKIVAMMPFPSIFKARGLSKSWLARLSAISPSEEDGPEMGLAAAFHRQVSERSNRWEVLSPVLIGTEDFMAYNQASQNWPRLPSLSFLPRNWHLRSLTWQLEGPLLYGFALNDVPLSDVEHVIVANVLTRTWRQLPARPNAQLAPVLCHKLVIYPNLEAYKVILFCEQEGRPDNYCAQIYESRSNSWSSKSFVVSSNFTDGPAVAAYLDGVFYMVGVKTPQSLLAFNVEEGTLRELRLSVQGYLRTATVNLVVCNAHSLMVVTKGLHRGGMYVDALLVFRVDLESLELVRLAEGPPRNLQLGTMPFLPAVGDGGCIFFKVEAGRSRVLAYNVEEDSWNCFPVPTSDARRVYHWLGSSFQPGLSPFVAV